MTKMQLTKEIHDLREKAAKLEDKLSDEFRELMIRINALKVRLQEFLKKEKKS